MAATDYDGGLNIVTPVEVSAGAAAWPTSGASPTAPGPTGRCSATPRAGWSEYISPVLVNGVDSPLGLELFAVAVDSTIWHNAQTAAGDWSDWASLGNTGGPVTGIAVAQDGRGALNVCLTHKDNTVTHRRQEAPGGAWTGWMSRARRTPARSLTPRSSSTPSTT